MRLFAAIDRAVVRALVGLACVFLGSAATAGGGTAVLANGAVGEASGSRERWCDFAVRVPANTFRLEVRTRGGSGDPDLYIQFGDVPTLTSFMRRSAVRGSSVEAVRVDAPRAGLWYFSTYGTRGYADVDIVPLVVPQVTAAAEAVRIGSQGSLGRYNVLLDLEAVAAPAGGNAKVLLADVGPALVQGSAFLTASVPSGTYISTLGFRTPLTVFPSSGGFVSRPRGTVQVQFPLDFRIGAEVIDAGTITVAVRLP